MQKLTENRIPKFSVNSSFSAKHLAGMLLEKYGNIFPLDSCSILVVG
jgi:hypothetical protein